MRKTYQKPQRYLLFPYLVFIGIVSGIVLINCSSPIVDMSGGDSSNSNNGGSQDIYVSCQISSVCMNILLNQCTAAGGSVVGSCGSESPNGGNGGNEGNGGSVPNNDVSVNCQISGACLNMLLSQCNILEGSLVASCGGSSTNGNGNGSISSNSSGGSSGPTNCLVYGVCYKNVTSSQCNSSGGNAVSSCEADASLPLYCDYGPPHTYGGGCERISNASQCKLLDGGMVTNTCGRMDRLYCDYGPTTTYGGGCHMIASQANCDTQWGTVVYQCPASSIGSAYYSYPTLPSQPPDPPVGSGQLYCDFGPLHSDGGGCEAISYASQCNRLDGGLVANSCGRTDRLYCDYGRRDIYGGGCFMIASQANCNTADGGRVVTECPLSSL